MFSNARLAASVLAFTSLLGFSSASPLERRQADMCYEPWVVYVSTNVISYPVVIQTYIAANTIININGGVTININNAPTSLDTTVTATATVTSYSTLTPGVNTITGTTIPGVTTIPGELTTIPGSTATVTAVPTNVAPATFVITINTGATKAKRQAAEYLTFIGSTASVTTDQSLAAQFSITNGLLVTGGLFVGLSNAELATGYAAFELFSSPPDIASFWSAVAGGAVSFENGAFAFGGFAEFCTAADGSLQIEATSSPPFACIQVSLTAVAVVAPTSTSTPTITSSSTSSTPNPSDDMTVEPSVTARALPLKMHKKSMNGEVRRGGLLRSPMKRNA